MADLQEDEKAFIEELLERQGSTQLMVARVEQKKKGVRKPRARLAVIGTYTFSLVKREGKKKLRLSGEAHFLDLSRLACTEKGKLELSFSNPKHALKEPVVFAIHSQEAPEMAACIRGAIARFSQAQPDSTLPRVDISKECMVLTNFPPTDSALGFLYSYQAYCSYFRTPSSIEVEQYLKDLREAKSKDFNFNDCPGVDPNCNLSFNAVALTCALRYNQYFRSVRCNGVPRKSLGSHLVNSLRFNECITRLEIVDMPPFDVGELGEALRANHNNALAVINLKNTPFSKGFNLFCNALQEFNHSLKVLNLSNCTKRPDAMYNLMTALRNNYGMSITLTELDVSFNRFDENACTALETWLSRLSEHSQLRVLKVADTGINFTGLAAYLPFLTHVEELDVSGNKIEMRGAQLLINAIDKSSNINIINVARCNLPTKFVAGILLSLLRNPRLKNTKVDVSDNDFAELDAEAISDSMTYSVNCHTLNLSNNKFKERGLIGLLQSMVLAQNRTLDTLILDNTFKNTYKGDKVASALVSTISCIPSLKSVRIAGGLGPVALPLFSQLKGNKTLLELDVRSNELGDIGASAIADLLRHNSTLMCLKCDDNGITATGWKMILSSFIHNNTLCFLPFPWKDYHRMFKDKLYPARLDEVRTILIDIQCALQTNQNGRDLTRFTWEEKQYPILDKVEPLATLPNELLNQKRASFIETPQEVEPPVVIPPVQEKKEPYRRETGRPSHKKYDDFTGDRTMAEQFTDYTETSAENTFNTYTEMGDSEEEAIKKDSRLRGPVRTKECMESSDEEFDVV